MYRKSNSSSSFVVALVVVLLWIGAIGGGVVGYVLNIVKTTKCDFDPVGKAEICRGVGIIIPFVGAIEGYLTIKD